MQEGAFIWYDLATTDPEAAARFYSTVVGWTPEPVPEMHYTLLKTGESRAAGLMALPEQVRSAGVPPHWTGYVMVGDVDGVAQRAQAAGATLRHGPEDIPGVGRFAVITDPQGAPINLFKPNGQGEPEPGFMTPGRVGWHELHARDWESAFGFYSGLFGWEREQAMDMGPMGTYQMFGYGGAGRGGMMNAMQNGGHASWLYYFVVSGIDLAVRRVQEAGGLVYHGPQEVPGGAWIIQGRDPQGAQFALVSAQR